VPPALVVLLVWLAFGGTRRDLRVPVGEAGDALFFLAQAKSTLDHGWWWVNPSLGVPEPYPPLVFGQTTNVDQAIVWLVGRVLHDVGPAINVTWAIMLALGAVTTAWGARRLGASALSAGSAGILFAMSPFAMARHLGHFNLVTYLVPMAATVAVLFATAGRDTVWRGRDLAVLAGGCALVGFNYIYNAFFGALLIAAGLVIGFGRTRSVPLLKAGAWCVGALVLATSLNLVPTALASRQHGSATGTEHLTMESEYYALKVRHLISPVFNHWFPPFRAWLDAEAAADFPNESENRTARLGLVAAVGWLALMVTLIVPARESDRDHDPVPAAARLSVAAILLATLGGLGSVFSLISPAIRGYNRIAPFMAFFALAAVAIWIDRLTAARPRAWRVVVCAAVLVVGLSDQWSITRGFASGGAQVSENWHRTSAFVADLEARLPDAAMVFQLPTRPYPRDPGVEKMGVYDHFRPYLVSRRLRWSYPALTSRQQRWEQSVIERPPLEWPAALAQHGFSAILVDRAGYADRGESLIALLRAGGAAPLAEDERYIALELRRR
jgi:hypothetical protein